ncbi:TetR/AcrR family transcriptional regulator [Sphaerisporangium aureirubrum]|uniref:TetR/AcrR family transcriptional regulator n=1 Tax=Sphaerisporangium aureirubrum TaxID=1544736 RepID=A0ABW1NSF3_9ACTN
MARGDVRERLTADDGRGVGAGEPAAARREEPVRRRLLGEATRLFADKGFENTSVQEIVSAAGVTKGAMYHYFGSKDDLLREVYARVLRLQTERLDRFADAPGPVADRVHAAAADVIMTTIDNLDDFKIFFRSMHQLAPETQKAVRAERRRYHERFRDLVREGQTSGVFRTDVPPDLVVDFFFGSVHHLGSWYRPDGALTPPEIGHHFADLLLSSLRP